MDRFWIKKIFIRARGFLFSSINREFLVFLFFLVVSAVFWMLQTLNETYEAEVKVPLRLSRVPDNVVITTDLPEAIYAKVSDKGMVLMRYVYGPLLSPITVDFNDYYDGRANGRIVVPLSEVENAVYKNLLSTSRVASLSLDTLEFYYNRGSHKRVPIRVSGTMDTAPLYYLAGVSAVPDSVAVFAPANILDTIRAAYTQPFVLENMTESQVFKCKLARVRGAKFEPDEAEVCINVDVYTQKTVEVPVTSVNFPACKNLRTFPGHVRITFRVGTSRFKEITAEKFVVSVAYEDIVANNYTKIPLQLKSIPEGVSQVRIEPAEVDYLIEQVAEE